MEAVTIFLVMASPPFVAALLVLLLRKWWPGFVLALCLLVAPILYPLWASQHLDFDHSAPLVQVPGLALMVLCTSLVISCLGWVKKAWLRMLLLPVLYILGLCVSVFIGMNLGVLKK